MRTISRITTQKRNKNRFNIYLKNGDQEKYGFSVDEDVLVRYSLYKGMEISQEQIDEILIEEDVQRAYQQAVRYLGYRMRSTGEMEVYLRRKDFTDPCISSVIQRLTDENWLDDLEFAQQFVQSRIRSSNKGPFLIEQELVQKGVASHFIKEALKQYSIDQQIEKGKKIVEKRLKRKSNHSFQRQKEQAQAALHRNGFSKEVIQQVMSYFQGKKNDEEEWNALLYQGERLWNRHIHKYADHFYELEQRVRHGLYQRGFSLSLIDKYIQKQVQVYKDQVGKEDKE